MIIFKKPIFENDSYCFQIDLIATELAEINLLDLEYYNAKREAFLYKDINKKRFEQFKERKSFGVFEALADLAGTVYTHTCQDKNGLSYERIIDAVINNYKSSRKCAINFADTLYDYLRLTTNTSCLNSIHYCGNNVTLYFRASDVENELLIDLHLIKEFFIDKVGKFATVTVFASTSQNNENLEPSKFVKSLNLK